MLGLRRCGQALVILKADVSVVTVGQRGLLAVARVGVGPSISIASLDWCSVVSVRRTGEHAQVNYPCVRHADRLLRLVGKPNLSGGKPDVPVLRR